MHVFAYSVKHECGYIHKPNEIAKTVLIPGITKHFDIFKVVCNGCSKTEGEWIRV